MKYQVVVTNRAAADLDAAYQWIAARSPQTAVRWYNRFLDALGSLCVQPERCPLAAEHRRFPVEIRQLVYGKRRSYRALFKNRERQGSHPPHSAFRAT